MSMSGGKYRKRQVQHGEDLFGECPTHGRSMEVKDSRRLGKYRRRRYHCMIATCKYRMTTAEVLVPEAAVQGFRQGGRRFGIRDFMEEVIT